MVLSLLLLLLFARLLRPADRLSELSRGGWCKTIPDEQGITSPWDNWLDPEALR